MEEAPLARLSQMLSSSEDVLEGLLQRHVHIVHGHRQAQIDEAGDAVARVFDAARDDAGEVRQIRFDVDRS